MSLSDTGNRFTFCRSSAACPTFPVGFPFAPPIAPYDNGRFSNGPVWVEYLAQGLGLPAPAPSNLGGTNFAWGGAETGTGISAQGTPNVGTQIGQFLLSIPAPRAGQAFPKERPAPAVLFLESGKVPSPDQLLVLWAGANDFNNATVLPNPTVLVNNIAADITMLAAAAPGQDLHLLVPNLPPLGETPRLVNTPLSRSKIVNSLFLGKRPARDRAGLGCSGA